MEYYFQIKMNERLYVRDPEKTSLGQKIIQFSIVMIHEHGFEFFTFKKLAQRIGATEASIYRYFENKHRLLVYIISWYWCWLEYQVIFHTNNIKQPEMQLKQVLKILTSGIEDNLAFKHIDKKILYQIVIDEGSKVYLTKQVENDNRERFFKPYKDLCTKISEIISKCHPGYVYPRSLASTIIETSHQQPFFMKNLPSLTDFGTAGSNSDVYLFIENLVFSSIKPKKK